MPNDTNDRERQSAREQILESLFKDIVANDPDTVAKISNNEGLAGHQGSGNQGTQGLNAV